MAYQNDAVAHQFDSGCSVPDHITIGSMTIAYRIKMIASGGALEDIRPLATDDDFCAFTGLTKQQSAQLRYLGTGPRFIRVTGRQIRYDWSQIEAWCKSRTVWRSDQRNGSAPRHNDDAHAELCAPEGAPQTPCRLAIQKPPSNLRPAAPDGRPQISIPSPTGRRTPKGEKEGKE
jgi:predicted DNA-binding transcriptional regulator AlpA